MTIHPDVEDDPDSPRILRHIELIDDEAAEYGIKICKCSDRLMAKKYGYRRPPGITYFRKGKFINYDGDIDDEEEVLDWLTDPENMELTDHIERVNRKMFDKIRQRSDYVAAFLCIYCTPHLQNLSFETVVFQTAPTANSVLACWQRWNTSTTRPTRRASTS